MKMKRICLMLSMSTVLGAGALSLPALAAPALGYVDVQKVFAQFKQAQSSQAAFQARAQKYEAELAEKNKELEQAKKAGKSKAELDKMTRTFEAELKPEKAAIEAMDRRLSGSLKTRIQSAIAKAAAAHRIPVVLDKQVVLYGGVNLTPEVLRDLNK